jgi:N4-gp56 family major capsid protein
MATTIDPTNITTTQPQYLLSTYYDKRLLERLVPVPVIWDHGQKKSLPKGEGKVVKWSRFVNLGNATNLTEATKSTALVISAVNVTATLRQLGDFMAVSDFVEMTAISSVVEGAVDVFATQAGQSLDVYANYELFGRKYCASTAYAPTFELSTWARSTWVLGSVSAISALNGKTIGFPVQVVNSLSSSSVRLKAFSAVYNASGAGMGAVPHPLTVQDIREAVQTLKESNVPTYDDGMYHAFIHPTAAAGLKRDAAWKEWNQNQLTKETFYKGEIGQVEGVKFMESTNVTKVSFDGTSVFKACFTTIVGKNAYGTIEVDGGQHVYVKQPNSYDTSNPLNQWTTIGWKITAACAILESTRGVHILSQNF